MQDTLLSRFTPARRWVFAGQVLAAVVGGALGYDFGLQISGQLLGVALALNAAVFCSMVVDVLADRIVRARTPR